ncbi:hypothetical protein [uncultured Tenacibaculum sp.]|uniref:hypothetical protein n=1 Tax=uncultured Tenacibaculum sp. TaxID=174713 RepID=UPI00260679E8|nr:hypothetical protein [uncultured Tenacibaculum sp.]
MKKKILLGITLLSLLSCYKTNNKNYLESRKDILLEIQPFETNKNEFDYKNQNNTIEYHIFVGKLKSNIVNRYKHLNQDSTYIQLNDKITGTKELKYFISCYHCNISEYNVLIHIDKKTLKEYLIKIEKEIVKCGIKKNHIYYFHENKKTKSFGYNNNY